MKKRGLLNTRLISLIAALGHTDLLVIGDAGLPVPPGVECIDLALVASVPGFLETLQAVLDELAVESVVLARETAVSSPALHAETLNLLGDLPVRSVTHAELKELTKSAHAVVRTGEVTPYANIVLVAGVTF